MDKLIVVAGATASGKTDVCVKLAKLTDGEIVNSDSMQVYRYMNIGTAKATQEEMQNIPHHMIDIVSPEFEYSVARYASEAEEVIGDIIKRGKTPILSGGTGLYIESLIYPYNFSNAGKNEDIRKELEYELNAKGTLYMYNQLLAIDPIDASKIHPNNTKRVIRALEIYRSTGRVKSDNCCEKTPKYDLSFYCIDRQKDELYAGIDKRVDMMFDNGLVDEVDSLLTVHELNFDMQSMQAIGYKEFRDLHNNTSDVNQVKAKIKLDSRHYAKRQLTWFRKYDFAQWVTPDELLDIYR